MINKLCMDRDNLPKYKIWMIPPKSELINKNHDIMQNIGYLPLSIKSNKQLLYKIYDIAINFTVVNGRKQEKY